MTDTTNTTPGVTTYRIGLRQDVPSAAPATEPYQHGGRTWTPAELAIIGRALDAGIFYQDAFEEACCADWVALHPHVGTSITAQGTRAWIDGPEDFQQRRALFEELKAELSGAPRGTWALVRTSRPRSGELPEHITWMAILADGIGGTQEPQTSHLRGAEPTHQMMMESMTGMDIYCARRAEEERREWVRNEELIAEHGWTAGTVLKNIRIGGTDYSTASITSLQDGVSLNLTKRGSRKRWTWRGKAQRIQLKDQPQAEGCRGDVQVTVEPSGDLLDMRKNAA
ncbi:MAG: hypothetical protein A2580_11730 [Hydrogenophilales bacterium RIFOXYD1_FULL_62_11]|nr:MAG: hypothetical protein A2580_11730 [Hydrogenophilales bacterium RIFOXYD1_FULL_62_11]